MTEQEIIESLEKLVAEGIKKATIEKELGMPINTLSGIMNQKRAFPAKWKYKLKRYIAFKNHFKLYADEAFRKAVLDTLNDSEAPKTYINLETVEVPKQLSDEEKAQIGKQIKAIRDEKIPELRNKSALGQKSWASDQKKRIQELESKLK